MRADPQALAEAERLAQPFARFDDVGVRELGDDRPGRERAVAHEVKPR